MLEELLIFIGPVVKGDYEKFGRFHQVLDLSLRNKLKLFLQSRRQSAGFGGKWWKLAISNNVLYKNRCIFFNEQADFGRKASYWGVFPWFRAISKQATQRVPFWTKKPCLSKPLSMIFRYTWCIFPPWFVGFFLGTGRKQGHKVSGDWFAPGVVKRSLTTNTERRGNLLGFHEIFPVEDLIIVFGWYILNCPRENIHLCWCRIRDHTWLEHVYMSRNFRWFIYFWPDDIMRRCWSNKYILFSNPKKEANNSLVKL